MPSFKVPCPSCEAPVLIKNPNLVGTKVECPKCKYRFKVEEPAADGAKKGDAKDKKGDAKGDKKTAAGAPGKNKKLVPILVGVGALVLLAVVGVMAFGGKKKPGYPGGGGGGGGGTGANLPVEEQPGPVKPPPTTVNGIPFSTKTTTNLLPGQAVAVYVFNLDKVRESPVYGALVDAHVGDAFEKSMGFPVSDVESYLHCFAGDGRDPFGVIRLKSPTKTADLATAMKLTAKSEDVKGRALHAAPPNPFVTAVSHAMSMRALFGDYYERVPMVPPLGAKDKPMGVCVYDAQHVLLGEYALLKQFLGELDADGYPPFKTVMAGGNAPAAPVAAPAPGADKALTSIDAYRTLEYPLKKALDDLEADKTAYPMFVYAEKFDLREYDPKLMKKEHSLLAGVLDPIAVRTRFVSANVVMFSAERLVANLRVTLDSVEDSRTVAKDQLSPGLSTMTEVLKLYLTTPIEFRDYTVTGGLPGRPGGPGGPLGFPLPPGTGPGGLGGPMGSPMPMGAGPGGLGGPMGFPMPPGPGTGPGPTDPANPPPAPVSHVDLGMIDNQILIAIDVTWGEAVNRTVVAPRMMGVANQIKGKMAIFSSEFSWHAVAAVGRKALADPDRKAFPRGTADRKSNTVRYGLEYPPVQRTSLFVDLLPYLGRGDLARRVDSKKAWYAFERERPDEQTPDKPGRILVDNLAPAGEWVPELLVPYYPQSAWRATSPYAPDHVLGATNYVAIAGVGLNVARENPNDPAFKTKVGITGYGWGSRAEEVTDGLSNTIYMMQTPPGLQQPWIAGGGATVRGLDEADPMGGFKYAHPGRTKPGTYALMGDGSVRYIPADIDPKVLLALSTRAGGEALTDINKDAPKVEAPKTAELKTEPKPPEEKKPEEKKEPAPPPEKK